MANVFHKSMVVSDGIHSPISFEYADATARLAASLLPADIGKFAHQLDDDTFYVLKDDSPLTWNSLAGSTPLSTKGDIFTYSTTETALGVGSNGQHIVAASGEVTGLKWETPASGSPLTTKGDIFGFTTVDARLPIGTDDQVLTADSAESIGFKWVNPDTPEINLSFGSEDTKLTTYEVLAAVRGLGTATRTLTAVKMIAHKESDLADFSLRLFDLTNALAIAEVTGQSNTTSVLIDLGTVSNQDSAEAIYEVQAKWDSSTDSGKEKVMVDFLNMVF